MATGHPGRPETCTHCIKVLAAGEGRRYGPDSDWFVPDRLGITGDCILCAACIAQAEGLTDEEKGLLGGDVDEAEWRYRCPRCRGTSLDVTVTSWAELVQDDPANLKTIVIDDDEWDGTSAMRCTYCGAVAPAGEFDTRPDPVVEPGSRAQHLQVFAWVDASYGLPPAAGEDGVSAVVLVSDGRRVSTGVYAHAERAWIVLLGEDSARSFQFAENLEGVEEWAPLPMGSAFLVDREAGST